MTVTSTYRTRRIAVGLTVKRLADLAGVSERTVRYLESGSSITDEYLARIDNALQVAEAQRDGVSVSRLDALEALQLEQAQAIAEMAEEIRQLAQGLREVREASGPGRARVERR